MKEGRHPEKALTAVAVRNTKTPGKYADGNGLYLIVTNTGGRKWIWRAVLNGKRCEIGLGGAGHGKVSLADARDAAVALAKLNRDGVDVLATKRAADKTIPTFKQAAEKVHEAHKLAWKNPKHADQWINTLTHYAFPTLGPRRVDQIQSGDVLTALSPIWLDKPETARRVRQRIRTVFDWAKASGFRTGDNPVDGVSKALPKQSDQVNPAHLKALPYSEVPSFLPKWRKSEAMESARLALEFLILTATRTSEVILSVWDEFDTDGKTWAIPAARMKAKRLHRVPLTPRCIEILKRAKELSGTGPYVFPGRSEGKPLSNMTMLKALADIDVDTTVHGFRSSFRDWAAERTNFPNDVVEMALAHTLRDKTEAAYKRTDLFDKRRDLMETWAAFVLATPGQLVTLNAKQSAQ